MTAVGLANLDELILSCRDHRSRKYIAEAVACYRAGATRAAIVTTWIAVVTDIISKIQELELAGDRQARQQIVELERWKSNKEIKKLQDFERDILNIASRDYELLSSLDYDDLKRLYEDRNRCAHPSFQSSDEVYDPSPELARFHIANAVRALLALPPVQGKAALDRIWAEVRSEYFPVDPERALTHLKTGPLVRARQPLVRSVIVGLTKSLCLEDRPRLERLRQFSALGAVSAMHREIFESVLAEPLPEIASGVSDERWHVVIEFLSHMPYAWHASGVAQQGKAERFVQTCACPDFDLAIVYAMEVDALASIAQTRLPDVSVSTIAEQIEVKPNSTLADEAVRRYVNVGNFRSAEYLGLRLVLPIAPHLTPEHVRIVLHGFSGNRQTWDASGTPDILADLFEGTRHHADELCDAWINVYAKIRDDLEMSTYDRLMQLIEDRYPDDALPF